MKCISIIAMFALINARVLSAPVYTETNDMPGQIHDLMDAEGYTIDQNNVGLPLQNTNSLRELLLAENARPSPLEFRTNNVGWKPWNNFTVKHVDSNPYAVTEWTPTSFSQTTTQFEYDIKYSFDF